MIRTETIENLRGFGSGGKAGEYYYSQNFAPGQFGLEAYTYLTQVAVSSAAGAAGRFTAFAEYGGFPYAIDINNKIFGNTGSGWERKINPGQAGRGNGLLTDQKGRLLYAQDRYLGVFSTTVNTDTWQDFGASFTDFRDGDTYEDWVLFGNGNNIAALNITDDSWNNAAFTLPSEFVIRAIRTNRTGILVGANVGNRGIVFLWDVRTQRSTSDWIWVNAKIQSICKAGDAWIVTTSKEQWLTDGYRLTRKLPSLPDSLLQNEIYHCIPNGTTVINGRVLIASADNNLSVTRHKSGLFVLNLATELFQFFPVSNNCVMDVTMGAVFQDSSFNVFVASSTTTPNTALLGQFLNNVPTRASVVIGPFGGGNDMKVAEAVRLDLAPIAIAQSLLQVGSVNISVKIYNFRRQLWAYGFTSGIGAATNQIPVNGITNGFNNAVVGDEVTILSGQNAGQVRHITTITGQNTTGEVWTLDSALPSLIESGVYINVQPFQMVKTHVINNTSLTALTEIRDLFFNVRNKVKGRKYLVKVVLDSINAYPISLNGVTFVYNDLGINTTQ